MASSDSLKQQTKRGLYWKLFEQFSNYGVQFIVGIFMARMLSPSDYGITALPAVFMAVAAIFADSCFSTALVRKPDLKEEDLSTAFIYSLSVGVVAYIVLFSASPWIADFYDVPVLKPLIRVSALGFLYGPIGTPQNIILQKRLDFKTPAKISVAVRFVSAIIGIGMAYWGYGVWALVISGMVGNIVSLIVKVWVVRWFPKTGWSKESFRYMWGFGNKMVASQLLDTLYNNITPVVIGKFYSPSDLGVYNRAASYAQLPSANLYGVISGVTFPVLSKMQDDPERLSHSYRRMLKVLAFITFPLMMGLAALAHPIIIVMVTAKWEDCVILLQLMCFSMMWYPIHALNLNVLLVKGESGKFFRLEVIKKIWGVSVMALTLPLGIVFFTAAGIVSSLFSLIVNTYYTGRIIDVGYWKQMRDYLPTLLLSLTMFAVCLSLTYLIPTMWLQIVVGILVGAAIYIGGALLFHFEELRDVRYLLQRKS